MKALKFNFRAVGSEMLADSQSFLASVRQNDEDFDFEMLSDLKDIKDEIERQKTLDLIKARYGGDRAKINFAVLAFRLMQGKTKRSLSKTLDRIDRFRNETGTNTIAPFSRGWYPGYLMSAFAEGQKLEFSYLQYDQFDWFSVTYLLPPVDIEKDHGRNCHLRFYGRQSVATKIRYSRSYSSLIEKESYRENFIQYAIRILKIAVLKNDLTEIIAALTLYKPFEKRVGHFICSLEFIDTPHYMGDPESFAVKFNIWAQPKSLWSRIFGSK